jgi:phosphatidate cytidylyltransferase
MTAMIVVVFVFGILEFYSVYSDGRPFVRLLTAVAGGLLLPVIFGVLQGYWHFLWLILPAGLWLPTLLLWEKRLTAILVYLWLSFPLATYLATAWAGRGSSYEPLYPLLLIIIIWTNDTFAYLTGSLMGRHRLTPRLSPGKTWEGTIGGLLFSMVTGWVIHRVTGTLNAGSWIVLSALMALLGLSGDLFESWLKRRAGVKNMGVLLPGHGGVLDRFDSLLFSAPVYYLIILWLL